MLGLYWDQCILLNCWAFIRINVFPDLYLIDVHVDLGSLDLHLSQAWVPFQLIHIGGHPGSQGHCNQGHVAGLRSQVPA